MNHQTRRDDLPDTPWASEGLCSEMPAEIFDGTHARLQTAKAACAHCTVARQCLRWAITTEIEDEVWGGRTPVEPRRITVAFVLDPPPTSSAPDLRTPGAQDAARAARRATTARQPRCAPQEAVPTGFTRHRCPRPQDSHQRPRRVRDRGRLQTAPSHRRADLRGLRRAVRDAQADRAARHAAGIPVATRSKVAPGGTPAGYARHRNRGEDACDRCTQANKTYLQTYRAQTRNAAS